MNIFDVINNISKTAKMIGTYEERKVEHTEVNGYVIDTVLVTDASWQ